MKLFKITQDEENGYDSYDSAVVVAKDEESAKKIHPSMRNGAWEEKYRYYDWASAPENVKAKYIGEAISELKEGDIVVSSFNAG